MNSRFAVCVHILTFLQTQAGTPASSELIASSVNTNPSLIRRLVSQLAKAGLTKAQLGAGGGVLLAKSGDDITLLDVYRAADEGGVFALHREPPNPQCPVGRNIQGVLEVHIGNAEKALQQELAQTTIAALATAIDAREHARR